MTHALAERRTGESGVGRGLVDHRGDASGEHREPRVRVDLHPAAVAGLGRSALRQEPAERGETPHAGIQGGETLTVRGGRLQQEGGGGRARRPLGRAVEVGPELRGQGAVQRELLEEGRVREFDEITEMRVGRLPGQPGEHPDVVVEEQVVLLQPGAEDGGIEVAPGDPGDGRVPQLLFDQWPADRFEVTCQTHAGSVTRRRAEQDRRQPPTSVRGTRSTTASAEGKHTLSCPSSQRTTYGGSPSWPCTATITACRSCSPT